MRPAPSRRRVALLLGAAVLLAACAANTDDLDARRCDEDSDCASNRCVQSVCELEEDNSSSNNNPSNNSDNDDCPDIDGTWSFEAHCDEELVGAEIRIREHECDLMIESLGWTGYIDEEGVTDFNGVVPGEGGEELYCVGGLDGADRLAFTCDPMCDLVLVRR